MSYANNIRSARCICCNNAPTKWRPEYATGIMTDLYMWPYCDRCSTRFKEGVLVNRQEAELLLIKHKL